MIGFPGSVQSQCSWGWPAFWEIGISKSAHMVRTRQSSSTITFCTDPSEGCSALWITKPIPTGSVCHTFDPRRATDTSQPGWDCYLLAMGDRTIRSHTGHIAFTIEMQCRDGTERMFVLRRSHWQIRLPHTAWHSGNIEKWISEVQSPQNNRNVTELNSCLDLWYEI